MLNKIKVVVMETCQPSNAAFPRAKNLLSFDVLLANPLDTVALIVRKKIGCKVTKRFAN